jgi:hypothetical protein
VVISSGDSVEGGDGRRVYAWNGDGSNVPNWPKGPLNGDVLAPPALGDLDGDGDLEVVVGCGTEAGVVVDRRCDELYVWNGDGSTFANFPFAPTVWRSAYNPILADYDGNGKVDILLAHYGSTGITTVEESGGVWSANAGLLQTSYFLYSAPLVEDLNGDGVAEIAVGGSNPSGKEGVVYIWQDGAWSADGERPWPMFHHDERNTGQYPTPPRLAFPDEVRIYHQEGSGTVATEYVTIRNAGDGEYDWAIAHGISELTVTPPSGTVTETAPVQFDVDVSGVPTGTWQNLGTVTVSGTFGGDAVYDSPKDVPVLIFVGDIERIYLPVLVRNSAN